MSEAFHPVVVFHAENELEAQMARDHLQAAMIPTLHVPSLTTGMFGMQQALKVAVPEDRVEEALEILLDAGFEAGREARPSGAAEVNAALVDALPRSGMRTYMLFLLALLILGGAVTAIKMILKSFSTVS